MSGMAAPRLSPFADSLLFASPPTNLDKFMPPRRPNWADAVAATLQRPARASAAAVAVPRIFMRRFIRFSMRMRVARVTDRLRNQGRGFFDRMVTLRDGTTA